MVADLFAEYAGRPYDPARGQAKIECLTAKGPPSARAVLSRRTPGDGPGVSHPRENEAEGSRENTRVRGIRPEVGHTRDETPPRGDQGRGFV